MRELKRNPKFFNNDSVPDTDSRGIELNNQGSSVIINLSFDHSRCQYTASTGNTASVNFNGFINGEERSLHTLILNNASNSGSKNFIFSNSFVFKDLTLTNNTVVVSGGKTAIFYGTIILGKMYLRTSIESNN